MQLQISRNPDNYTEMANKACTWLREISGWLSRTSIAYLPSLYWTDLQLHLSFMYLEWKQESQFDDSGLIAPPCSALLLPPFPFFPPFLPSSRVTCCDFAGATSGEVSYFENRDSRREEERRGGGGQKVFIMSARSKRGRDTTKANHYSFHWS